MPQRNNNIGFSGKVISEEIDFPFPRNPGEIVSPIPRPVGGHIPKVVTDDNLGSVGKPVTEKIDFSLICQPGEAPPCLCRSEAVRNIVTDYDRYANTSFFQLIINDLRDLCLRKIRWLRRW